MKPFAALGFSRLTAQKIGLPAALLLHYIRKRLKGTSHQFDGRLWISHSLTEWRAQFPFWSKSVLSQTLNSLEKQGLLTIRVLRIPRKRVFFTLNLPKVNKPLSIQKQGEHFHEAVREEFRMTIQKQLQKFCRSGDA